MPAGCLKATPSCGLVYVAQVCGAGWARAAVQVRAVARVVRVAVRRFMGGCFDELVAFKL